MPLPHVPFQVSTPNRCSPAQFTDVGIEGKFEVGSTIGVDSEMFVQVWRISKPARADTADEGFHARVRSFVYREAVAAIVDLAAIAADMKVCGHGLLRWFLFPGEWGCAISRVNMGFQFVGLSESTIANATLIARRPWSNNTNYRLKLSPTFEIENYKCSLLFFGIVLPEFEEY